MPSVRERTRSTPSAPKNTPARSGLPVRWAFIALTTGVAGTVGPGAGDSRVEAIIVAAAVATALHTILA